MADEEKRTHERIDCSRLYVTYAIEHHPDGLEEVDPKECGGTHDLMVVSVIHGEDGNTSTAFLGMNALGEPMSAFDKFRIWTLLADELAKELPPGGRRQIAKFVFESIREAIVRGRGGGDDPTPPGR